MKSICIIHCLFIVAILETGCQKETPKEDMKKPVEWNWQFISKPMGDSEVNSITIHPNDDNLWFVTSYKGIYVTRNGGQSWENYLKGFVIALEISPNDPSKIFAGAGKEIYVSKDLGKSWSLKYTFPGYIYSMMVSKVDNAVYVGLHWGGINSPNGIYKSVDMGETWKFYPYNVPAKGLIPWDIEEDATNKKIYIGTEIYDHPQPYHPPFLRSSDGGLTWQDISGTLPWHAIKTQVHPQTHEVYTLLEGPGLYYSNDFGDHWNRLGSPFYLDFIIDKKNPQTFFGGSQVYLQSKGGVYQSNDTGRNFKLMALEGHIAGSLCLNGNSTALYLASYKSGIFRAR